MQSVCIQRESICVFVYPTEIVDSKEGVNVSHCHNLGVTTFAQTDTVLVTV